MTFFNRNLFLLAATLIVVVAAEEARANHGPGASGGGSSVVSGETLEPGHFELSLREDYTNFEHFSRSAAAARGLAGGDFDALDHGFLTSIEAAYGVIDDLQVGIGIGYFFGNEFISADRQADGSVEVASAEPEGLTDLALVAKYRVLKGWPGNLAVFGGVIFPTGRTDVRLDNGERLSPTDQPGTGRWAFPIGVAYSRFLTSAVTLDASAAYTFRAEKDDFKVGDRFDAGLALAYRLTPSIKQFPQYSVFLELNDVYLMKDRADGGHDPNSGSNTLYLTPGARVRFDPMIALTLAPSFPVYQHVNGDQGKVEFKVSVSLSLAF